MEKTLNKNTTKKTFKTKIRFKLEKILTDYQLRKIKQIVYKVRLNKAYKFDQRIYSNNSFGFVPKYKFENLRGKITLHYHSIEKGMSNENIRLGFGERAFRDLFYSLDRYIEKKFDPNDERFLSALNIMEAYVNYHEEHNFDVPIVKSRLNKYKQYCASNNQKSVAKPKRSISKEEVLQSINMPFDKFAKSRMSIRNYSDEKVNLNLVEEAIEIAASTPSVCNRQPWKVYIIKDYNKIQEVMKIQKGLNQIERENIPLLLAVTVDTAYFSSDRERNEPFVDGGLFSMSLLYALHNKGLAACSLNANMSNSDLEKEHKLIGITPSERIIMFISVGNYKDVVNAPLSSRDNVDKYIEYL